MRRPPLFPAAALLLGLTATACSSPIEVGSTDLEPLPREVPTTLGESDPPPTTVQQPDDPPRRPPVPDAEPVPDDTPNLDDPEPTPASNRPVPTDGTPVFNGHFADPFAFEADGTYMAVATNSRSHNVPLVGAEGYLGDLLPQLPEWTVPGWVWAPSIIELDGQWVLYYTTRHVASGLQCISMAVGADPQGPFVDDSDEPFICDIDFGGSIDPSPFIDVDGTPYLLWKSDGNCCLMPTAIVSQQLAPDGLTLVGDPHVLLISELSWEVGVIEGPSMAYLDGTYHLLYSAGLWDSASYAIGHATCHGPLGTCTRSSVEPWLERYGQAVGTGGQEFLTGPGGQPTLVFHGWTDGAVHDPSARNVYVARVTTVDDDLLLVDRTG